MDVVGQSIHRIDAESKVSGKALYPGDYNLPNQLYMKVLFARRPHAVVKSIDTKAAANQPGVVAIFTASDVPNNEYGLGIKDQPVLCGPGSNQPFADHMRYIGDKIALIVAESEQQAEEARKLIKVEFEDLPIVDSIEAALAADAPLVHPDHGSNVCVNYRIRKGNVDEAFAGADVIVEEEYRTPVQEHAYLQPEAGISYMDEEGRVTVVAGGQWTHEDREQVAHALNLEEDQVRIIYPVVGGAFGGREDMSVQIILGLATLRLHARGIDRPVKIIWSREESMIGHHKRHPFIIRSKWGATADGKIVAAQNELYADGGAYYSTSPKVLGNATLLSTGPYLIPNVKVDTIGVYTNNITSAAFRGFGGPQAAFAAEGQVNRLAEKLGMDPVEFRMRNLIHDGDLLSVGTPLPPGVSIEEVTEKCAREAGWTKTDEGWKRPAVESSAPNHSKGLGFAVGFKNVGFSFGYQENSWAAIELYGEQEIDHAVLRQAAAEVGQGSHTVMVQMAAQALQLPVEKITLAAADTAITQSAGSVSASRMTFMSGNAILGAAKEALKRWEAEERPAIGEYTYLAPKTSAFDPETGKSEPNFAYGYVAEAIESEVDTESGEVHVKNVVCVDDVGKAVNPQQVIGQVEGAIVQANGYGTIENFIQRKGAALTTKMSTYLIPTVLDVPDVVKTVLVEEADPRGPFGVRGMGEMPYLPYVAALAASVKDATGIWFNDFPLTAERVWKELRKKE
jgi:CO/xanthine dehydrogenase Mo-binding subunit